jgi:hypothetical protein
METIRNCGNLDYFSLTICDLSDTICVPCSVHVRTMFVQHCLHGTKNGVFYEQGTKEVRTKPNIGVSIVPILTGIPINFGQFQSEFERTAIFFSFCAVTVHS